MIVTVSSVKSLQAKQGLPLLNQIMGWTILCTFFFFLLFLLVDSLYCLVVSMAFPFFVRCDAHDKSTKTLMYFFGFCPLFIILSISVEGLFFVSYSVTLLTWVKVERIVHPEKDFKKNHLAGKEIKESEVALSRSWVYGFQPDDLRIALFFLFFVQVGFFGTGK
jgi:phosphatidylinositol glycan class N